MLILEDVLISVIIPVYNVEKYVVYCVKSILRQTYKKLEIILVDDGSTDKSGVLCDSLADFDDRIVVIHKTNGGLSDARNAGLNIAHGDYYGFVDSDDYIEEHMYERLLHSCAETKSEIAMCGRYIVHEDTDDKRPLFAKNAISVFSRTEAVRNLLLSQDCDVAAWDKLYKSELFEGMRYPVGVLHEDMNFTIRLFHKCTSIVHIGTPEYNYLVRRNSICRQKFSAQKLDLYEQAKLGKNFADENYPELSKEAEAYLLRAVASLIGTASGSLMSKSDATIIKKLVFTYTHKILMNKYMKKQKVRYLKDCIKLVYRTKKLGEE